MPFSLISRVVAAAALGAAAAAIATGTASAHVEVSTPAPIRGDDAVLTFRVPNESATNSPTVALAVQLPALYAADTLPVPGWKSNTAKDPAGRFTSVTWTADPGAGIAPGQFQLFSVLAETLPDQDHVTFPATQTYADGEVVKWDQPPNPDGSDPERPVPALTLTPKNTDTAMTHNNTPNASDSTARWLGGIGIGLAIFSLGGVAGLLLRRRS